MSSLVISGNLRGVRGHRPPVLQPRDEGVCINRQEVKCSCIYFFSSYKLLDYYIGTIYMSVNSGDLDRKVIDLMTI